MNLPALPPVLDLLIYGALLYTMHQCLFRFPKVYLFLAILTLIKAGHTQLPYTNVFWMFSSLLVFGCLLLGLFLARKSANFFWLFSGLLLIKEVDIVMSPLLKTHGAFFFLWGILLDALALFLIDQRTRIVSAMASICRGELQRWAKAATPYQRDSYQEVALMLIYWAYMAYSLCTLVEYVIYHYYGWPPGLFYKTYSLVKTPLNVLELGVLFYLATGRAVTLVGRNPMH